MDCVAVDLFCGIGGLTHGVQKTGIKVAAGVDIDPSCRYAYESNNESIFINKSIEDITVEEIKALYPKNCFTVLMGCAPCQPFSNYSLRYAKDGRRDDRWKLLYYFLKIVEMMKPDVVSMENVPQLAKEQVYRDFTGGLECVGYGVNWRVLNCAQYGVPQNRNRLVLLASRHGEIGMIAPEYSEDSFLTVSDAINGLPPIGDGEGLDNDPIHRASKLSKMNKRRIRQSVPGGTWRDWDEVLQLPCHKKLTGRGYTSIYGRMEWGKPSPTITTEFYLYGSGRFGHPEQDRPISLREGSLLQSFPVGYKFIDKQNPQTNKQLGAHIGNAVPVELGRAIGVSIQEHILQV